MVEVHNICHIYNLFLLIKCANSDRPESHDGAVLTRLSFADGSVPRCLRGALPAERLLFQDPQRTAGVPLLLHNENPSGGLVVGAFSVCGAVLEEDLNLFRFLRPEEIQWPDNFKPPKFASAQSSTNGQEETNYFKQHTDTLSQSNFRKATFERQKHRRPSIPVHQDSTLLDALVINAYVSPLDVYRSVSLSRITQGRDNRKNNGKYNDPPLYVSRRFSDGTLSVVSKTGRVPIKLQRVFDFDIVSFAPVLGVGDFAESSWIAVPGHAKMYNGGGSVLYSAVEGTGDERDNENQAQSVSLKMRLLGAGEYVIVASKDVYFGRVLSCQPLIPSSNGRLGGKRVVVESIVEQPSVEIGGNVDVVFDGSEVESTSKSEFTEWRVTLAVESPVTSGSNGRGNGEDNTNGEEVTEIVIELFIRRR